MQKLSFRTSFLLFLLAATYIVVGSMYDNRRFRQHFEAFNQADLAGTLTFVEPAYKGVAIGVEGRNDQHYVFYPYEDQRLDAGYSFLALARKGDYVQKRAHSDTLMLLKNSRRYRYLFKVPGTSLFIPYRLRN